jgi:hypothetical protein
MNLREFIQRIKNRVNPPPEPLSNEAVLGFLRVLENVDKEEITCSELFVKLDEYVETEVHGQDPAKVMPLMREHLDVCSECCEEYEALLHVVEETESKK